MTITREQVVQTLRDIIAVDPEGSNGGDCFYGKYEDATQPNCLVAQVAFRLGNFAEVQQLDNHDIDSGVEPNSDLFARLGYTADAIDLLHQAQLLADKPVEADGRAGVRPWHDALVDLGVIEECDAP